MKRGKQFKVVSVLVALMLTVFTYSQTGIDHELDQILYDAYQNGEVEITPVTPVERESWKRANFYNLASIFGEQEKVPFIGGNEYVMERLDTGAILKLEISPQSGILTQLKGKSVLVEENITFSSHEIDTQEDSGPTNSIQNYLNIPTQYQHLISETESEVVIALIDSGFANIENYKDRLPEHSQGWNFVNNNDEITDTNGHGTHLAGIMLALSNAKILPVQALDANKSVTLDRLLAAINYSLEQDADIINLSIGSASDSNILKNILSDVTAQGVIVVASAGNNNENYVLNPAAYHDVVGVGAVNQDGYRAYYSNYGPQVKLSYTGKALSLSKNPDYLVIKEGTSQAAAAVSAVIATLKAHMPEADQSTLVELLRTTGSYEEDSGLGAIINLEILTSEIKNLTTSEQ